MYVGHSVTMKGNLCTLVTSQVTLVTKSDIRAALV